MEHLHGPVLHRVLRVLNRVLGVLHRVLGLGVVGATRRSSDGGGSRHIPDSRDRERPGLERFPLAAGVCKHLSVRLPLSILSRAPKTVS